MADSRKFLAPVHPGAVLREDFMAPLGLTMNGLALDLRVPVTRIAEIVRERRAITPDTALRSGRYFSTSARSWMNLLAPRDLDAVGDKLQGVIERDVHPLPVLTSDPAYSPILGSTPGALSHHAFQWA
jgi:addiction module HigA family antidote